MPSPWQDDLVILCALMYVSINQRAKSNTKPYISQQSNLLQLSDPKTLIVSFNVTQPQVNVRADSLHGLHTETASQVLSVRPRSRQAKAISKGEKNSWYQLRLWINLTYLICVLCCTQDQRNLEKFRVLYWSICLELAFVSKISISTHTLGS